MIGLLLVIVIGGVFWQEYSTRGKACKGVVVSIENHGEDGFLTKESIVKEVESLYSEDITNLKLIHIDADKVENTVKNNIFVKDAEVLKNHKGQLYVSLEQEVPVLRVMTEKQSYYVAKSGHKLPLSSHYTARVMLLRCLEKDSLFLENKNKMEFESDFLSMISFINKEKFLKAQLCKVWLDNKGELTFYPQVTKTKIVFGSCEKYKEKCEKIKLFYDQVLPRKGWNSYKTVNVKFNDQIVCE